MSKFKPYLIILGAFCAGCVIGAAWFEHRFSFLVWHQASTSTSIKANLAVATLRSIRAGDTNKATERLEAQLDRDVLYLADIWLDCPRPETERSALEALARARDYRVQFPRKTDSSITDKAVGNAFSLVKEPVKP